MQDDRRRKLLVQQRNAVDRGVYNQSQSGEHDDEYVSLAMWYRATVLEVAPASASPD